MIERRRTLVAVGILVVVLFVLGLSLAYPFSTTETSSPPGKHADPAFTTPYEIEKSVTISLDDGEPEFHQHQRFVADETQVLEEYYLAEPNIGSWESVVYAETNEGWSATRSVTENAETKAEWVEGKNESEIVDRKSGDDEYVLVSANNESASLEERVTDFYRSGAWQLNLYQPNYERHGTDTFEGHSVEVYRPEDGWYERPHMKGDFSEFRAIESDGELYVDEETGVMLYANVSYTLVDASNYAEYRYAKWDGDAVFTATIHYEFSEDADVEPPEWAAELD